MSDELAVLGTAYRKAVTANRKAQQVSSPSKRRELEVVELKAKHAYREASKAAGFSAVLTERTIDKLREGGIRDFMRYKVLGAEIVGYAEREGSRDE